MSYTNTIDYNEENNKKFIEFLNKELEIGINIKNKSEWTLFLESITTPAFSKMYNESEKNIKMQNKINNYEVSEFKGDAIVGYIAVTKIIGKDKVGKMDDEKQKLVSNERLSDIFDKLKLDRFIYTQSNSEISLKIKADVIEALVYGIHEKSILKVTDFLRRYLSEEDILQDWIILD